VIGAGIVGVCSALSLQRNGVEVTIVDPLEPGGHASSSNAGMITNFSVLPLASPSVLRRVPSMLLDPLSPLRIRWSYAPAIAPWLVRFVLSSRPRRVHEISRTLGTLAAHVKPAYEPLLAEADAEDLVRRNGVLILYHSAERFARGKAAREARRGLGVRVDDLDARGVAEVEPTLRTVNHGAWFRDAIWTTDPAALVRRLAARFTAQGGQIRCDRAVGFRVDGDHPVAVIGQREQYACDAVVVAAGAWSRSLALRLGDRVPLDTERGYVVMLPEAGVSPGVSMLSVDHDIALTPMAGGLRVTGMDELGGLKLPPDPRRARTVTEAARQVYPELSTRGGRWWMSFRPSMPDSLPVIGRSSRYPWAVYAFGHGHSGLGLGAITGRIVADLVFERPTPFDVSALRPERFALHRVPPRFGSFRGHTPPIGKPGVGSAAPLPA
jgi:D-amino-acid dehydrogenase